MNKTVSNIAPTIVGFLDTLPILSQKINAVYEENLDYEAALKKFVGEREDSPEENTYPLLIFRRSVIRHMEHGVSRRLTNYKILDPSYSNDAFETYKGMFGEFDVEFLLVHPEMIELEKFELSYMTEAGQPTAKKFSYQLPSMGNFEFFAKYDVLSEKRIETQNNHFKGLVGTASIRGCYFVATGTAAKIKTIDLKIKDLAEGTNLQTILITP